MSRRALLSSARASLAALVGTGACVSLGALLAACGPSGEATPAGPSASATAAASDSVGTALNPATPLSLAAQVGQKMFFDASLSASGRMACSTCHDPKHAYAPSNDLSAQLGGPAMNQTGTRAVPSLRYKDATPPYADLLDNPDGVSVPGPGGGFAWDGRAATLAEQAGLPLLDPREMANASRADVVTQLQAGPYAALFRQAFGAQVFDEVDRAFAAAGQALQAFQLEDVSFHPYSSKFDLYIGNKIGGVLTPAEARGLKVFADPNGGNCASCHYQGAGLNGSTAIFTDFSYEAIGVPRNAALPVNADPGHVDLGLCGPARTDHPPTPGNRFCGMFKSPTLRNVASRRSFFHNGIFHSLEQTIRFYNTRDTMPELWYPTVGGQAKATPDPDFPGYGLITTQYVGGQVRKFDDLPARFVGNIDTQMPLDGRPAHSKPPMSEQDIADLLCFLNTLNDKDVQPAEPPKPGACTS